ncbi:hypothetical protein F511_09659 [Dorcoceras hygrometricum]|uniref:Uncharacterized protein n=1 Tax=Dorcoceras hygrometricum TaxID=472368 RepID=A0A2Z7AIA2_9LAMI|nr:hypothetical protein F511_09659 [Dorcoceras hygrometricum]
MWRNRLRPTTRILGARPQATGRPSTHDDRAGSSNFAQPCAKNHQLPAAFRAANARNSARCGAAARGGVGQLTCDKNFVFQSEIQRWVTFLATRAWIRPVSQGNRHFTVGGGRLRQSGPRPEARLLRHPALEGLTRSARTDSPRRVGRNKFRRSEAAATAAAF